MTPMVEKSLPTDVPRSADANGAARSNRKDLAGATAPVKPKSTGVWQRRFVTFFASLLLIASVAGLLVGIGYLKVMQIQAAMSAPPPPEMPVAVQLATATTAQVSPKTTVVGTVLAPQMIVLRNEEPGTVTEVLMQPGGLVAKGDLLLRMDTRVERAQLEAAKATLAQAQAQLQRDKQLGRSNMLSGADLDISVAAAARARAEVTRLEAIIDHKELRAPFDAHVGLFQMHTGQYLDVATEIVRLEGRDTYLQIDFAVPAHVADTIQTGHEVAVQITKDSSSIAAQIAAIDAGADATTRLTTMRARLEAPPRQLVPGDSVLVTVPYGQPTPVVVVPRTAVRRSPSGDVVYVARRQAQDQSLRATAAMVTFAGTDESQCFIITGLNAGDRVVASGSFKVFEGSLLADTDAAPQMTSVENQQNPAQNDTADSAEEALP